MTGDKKKRRHLSREVRGRLTFTYVVIICCFLALAGYIIFWTVRNGRTYGTAVLGQKTNSSEEIPYERGKIYDRNGNLLAGNEKLYTLIVEPKNIFDGTEQKQSDYLNATVKALGEYFELDTETIEKKIKDNPDSYYIPLKTGLTYQEVEKFEEFCALAQEEIVKTDPVERQIQIKAARNVRGVSFETSYKRIYPYNTLACHLLGFTSAGNVGNWGLEQYYNSTLNGTNGRSYTYFEEDMVQEETVREAVDGNSLVSTIDLQIQQVVEEKLAEFDEEIGSSETSIIVMDPDNGEILAMASSDPFDLNNPSDESYLSYKYSDKEIEEIYEYTQEVLEKERKGEEVEADENKKTKWQAMSAIWRNPIISDTYEPGSTFKPFTVSAGLESGVLSGDEEYVCTGSYSTDNRSIGCSHVHGNISLKDSIAQSCNVAMMNIAIKKLKADNFYYYQNLFGFGQKTGIDLPGEADTSSLVYTAATAALDNNNINLATNSFGQNFNCTMIEMVSGFASLINGGNYYKPHVVKEIQNSDGDIVETKEKELVRKTISEATCKVIKSYMKETVKSGTGTKAAIAGYEVGGKTGTAEKRGRNKKDYIISFMGFTPIDDPELLIYVTIDEPHVKDQSTSTRLAVGLERECMKEIVDILGIEPSKSTDKEDENDKTYYLDEFKKQKTKD